MSASMADDLLRRVKRAAAVVRQDLALVGKVASYAWPEGGQTRWPGYSYDIPKEEQIRSAFWAGLHDRKQIACELEWNIYEKGPRGVQVTGEIDLAGFSIVDTGRGDPVLLLEVKRWWSLHGWNNKRAELGAGIDADIRKLRGVLASLKGSGACPPVAGVIVVGFANSADRLDESWSKLKPAAAMREEPLWHDGEEALWTVGESGYCSRADFLVLLT